MHQSMIRYQSLTTHLSDKVHCIAIHGCVCLAIGNSQTSKGRHAHIIISDMD